MDAEGGRDATKAEPSTKGCYLPLPETVRVAKMLLLPLVVCLDISLLFGKSSVLRQDAEVRYHW